MFFDEESKDRIEFIISRLKILKYEIKYGVLNLKTWFKVIGLS